MRFRWVAAGLVAGLAVLILTVSAGIALRSLHAPHAGWSGSHVDVVLEPGLHAEAMLDRLHRNGVLRAPGTIRLWLRIRGKSGKLRAGEYRFEQPQSAIEIVERLIDGDVLLHPVTVPEGFTLDEISGRFSESGFGSHESLLAPFRNPEPIQDLDPTAEDLEGYLFPDTYYFPSTTSAEIIAEAMVTRFRNVTGEAFLESAEKVGLGLREAVTLASLIEKETGVADERRVISSVFHNRLQRGMRMQCDPTVRFALARAGQPTERLSRKDLTFDSPWNTYVVRGLPPGPIASPGKASLLAAVSPADGDLLYFVAAPGGGHQFSEDLVSHEKAVKVWRRYSRSSR
jgi:UPF0755 protein